MSFWQMFGFSLVAGMVGGLVGGVTLLFFAWLSFRRERKKMR